jgi:CDP-6-deoxy-D-xylo-4-hexulose-3-dehydrase
MTRSTKDPRRIGYAGSVHDEREIEAVVAVLRGGPTALRIGRNVRAMEQRVAGLFGKRRGVMCNSGSSALYLAVDLLDLEPGDEVVTAAATWRRSSGPARCPPSSTSPPTPSRSTSTPSRR